MAVCGPTRMPARSSRATTGASGEPVTAGNSGASSSGRPSGRSKRTSPATLSATRNPPSCTRPVMPPAQQDQVVERCRPAVRPVLHSGARRCAAPGSRGSGSARPAPPAPGAARARWSGSGGQHVEHLAGRAVVHRDGRGVARQPPGRLGGDVDAASLVEHRLAAAGSARAHCMRAAHLAAGCRGPAAAGLAADGACPFASPAGAQEASSTAADAADCAPPRRSCGNVRRGRHAPLDLGRVGVNSAPVGRDGAVDCSIVVWNALVRAAVVHPATLGQRVGVHMHDRLLAVARRARGQPAGQCALGAPCFE